MPTQFLNGLRGILSRAIGHLPGGAAPLIATRSARAGCQALLLVLLAMELGSAQYGQYAGTLALVSMLFPAVGLGLIPYALYQCSTQADKRDYIVSQAAYISIVTGIILTIILITIGWLGLADRELLSLLAALSLADLVLLPLLDLSAQASLGLGRPWLSGVAHLAPVLFRLLALVSLILGGVRITLENWAAAYLLATTCAAAILPLAITRLLGVRVLAIQRARAVGVPIRSALGYCVNAISGKVSVDADKAIMLRLTTPSDTGLYSVAYRIADLAFLPGAATLSARARDVFQAAQEGGLTRATRRTITPLCWALALALIAAVCAFLLRDVLVLLLGPSYEPLTEMLVWFLPLPIVLCLRAAARIVLQAMQAPRALGCIEFAAAAFNVCGTIYLVTSFGWKGALAATYLAELAALGGTIILVGVSVANRKAR